MGKRKGRLSAGSVLMLALTVLVLLGSALVLLRLKSGTVRPVVRTDVEALTGIGGREEEPEAENAEAAEKLAMEKTGNDEAYYLHKYDSVWEREVIEVNEDTETTDDTDLTD